MQTKKEDTGGLFDGNNLLNQITNISKAHAYDILVEQVQELKGAIRGLIEVGELEDIVFTDNAATAEFQALVKRVKFISTKF